MQELPLAIFIKMSRIINQINNNTSRIVGKYDLTLSQFAVLEVLYHKGELTIGEVQKKILSSTGTMPVIVKNLEKRQYLTRTQSPNDKRQFILSLTKEGLAVISKVYPINEEMILHEFSMLTVDEQKILFNLLRKKEL